MTTRARAVLGLILLVHVALSLLVNYITPVFEGPDEPNHYLFIRYLQVDHALPVQGAVKDAVRAHHPPLYFALDALITLLAPAPANVTADFPSLGLQLNPRYFFRFDDPEPDLKSVFLHFGPDELWPYHGLPLTVHVARLLSLAFTLLAVWLTFVAAGHLRAGASDTRFAALAAGLVAFNPMVLFMSGVVQNDASALAAGAAVMAALGWLRRRGASPRRWLVVGVIFAAGILLKAGILAMGAPIALVMLFENLAETGVVGRAIARPTTPVSGKSSLIAGETRPAVVFVKALAVAGLAVAVPVAVIDGWWFVRNQVLYGDWTANASIVALWGPLSPEAQRQFLPLALYTLATGMLGRFGNGGIIDFSRGAYGVAGLLVLFALIGAAVLAWRAVSPIRAALSAGNDIGRRGGSHLPATQVRGSRSTPSGETRPHTAAGQADAAPPRLYGSAANPVSQPSPRSDAAGLPPASLQRGVGRLAAIAPETAVLWAAHALTVVSITISVIIFALKFNGGATGKYLFPMFPSLALILAAGWLAWFPARWQRWSAAGLNGLNAAVSVYAVFGLLLPAFGPPRGPLPGEMNGATPLEADLGGDARLLAYRVDRQALHPGDTLHVTVYWLPEATTPVPYTVFVHLLDPAQDTLAQRDLYPGGGTYRTTLWQPGRPFVDTYALHLPADAPATPDAQIVIGLYDEKTGQRLTATGGDAGPPGADWIVLGRVSVAH